MERCRAGAHAAERHPIGKSLPLNLRLQLRTGSTSLCKQVPQRSSTHGDSFGSRSRCHLCNMPSALKRSEPTLLVAANNGQQQGHGITNNVPSQTSSPGAGGGGPDGDPSTGDSYQIGLDPFTQQLMLSVLTAGAAMAIAACAHQDLASAFRLDGEALTVAIELSAPVLVLLAAVVAPRWAPPFRGSELERLQHNYYMTAQVLQLYLDFGDDSDSDDESDTLTSRSNSSRETNGSGNGTGSSSGRSSKSDENWAGNGGSSGSSSTNGRANASSSASSSSSSSSGAERARVRRRLRLEQTVGWNTISSGLALMQAFTLQPWNEPTPTSVFLPALAGRCAQQLANEFLIRGAGWGLLSGWVAATVSAADADDGILFFSKVFAGPDAAKYAAGLALVAVSLPGALWEARAARNFVRASVVGPVRDAAIFCTGNGVDEPAYCDPKGFAMMAARRPANAAPVADVVTRTRGWRSGPQSSFSSVSSLSSIDTADLRSEDMKPQPVPPKEAATASTATAARVTAPGSPPSHAPTDAQAPSKPDASQNGSSPSSQHPQPPVAAKATAAAEAPPSSSTSTSTSSNPAAAAAAAAPFLPRLGPTLSASSAAFEWDSEDMAVLLRVETLQDKIAFWSSLYYQLLAAFAINGAFLASDCNLFASFTAAWLIRTGPLLLSEMRARTAARAAG
ncbi:hypothetical protein Agub_g2440 [Astrephomene gubernaculifera]|uniref:Uncharacterized protein n=1 Tax=Astrephomene gubernaculifera TaxID=47775 RepID=A0AAD3DJ71_9CHLO|nr:hypothetical protein Agub_g2440 [Astrephomene gubernaculifera]